MFMDGSKKFTKAEINNEATLHVLTKEDSVKLIHYINSLKATISSIIKRDSLPEGVWVPSEDFNFLIRQDK